MTAQLSAVATAAVERLVASAPPLSGPQRDVIRRVLSQGRAGATGKLPWVSPVAPSPSENMTSER